MVRSKKLKNLSVLYVEDDFTLRKLMEKTLSKLCSMVYSVSNGDEALDVFNKYLIHIVILDIYLDGLNGLEVAKKIREQNDKIPILVVSGSIETEDLIAACALNLTQYVRKPIDFKKFLEALSLAVDRLESEGLLFVNLNSTVSYDQVTKSFVKQDGTREYLTKNEFRTLELFLNNRGQVIPYERFAQVIDEDLTDGALKNMIFRMRKKMGDSTNLRNLAKVGYIFT